MKDYGIRRNASGYYDDTAYRGMTSGPQPGEIWADRRGGEHRLILANNGALCICMKLYENWMPGEIAVTSRAQMYINPSKVSYMHTEELTQYIKAAREEEYKFVRQAVARAMGFAKAGMDSD